MGALARYTSNIPLRERPTDVSKLRCWDGTIASALRLILKVQQGGIARGDGRNAANRSATDSLLHLGKCARRAGYWKHAHAVRSARTRFREQRYGRLPGCASLGLDAGYGAAIANQSREHPHKASHRDIGAPDSDIGGAHGYIGTPHRNACASDFHLERRRLDSIITNCHSSD